MIWPFGRKGGHPRRRIHKQMVLDYIHEVDEQTRGRKVERRVAILSGADILVVCGARLKWREYAPFHSRNGAMRLLYGTEKHVWERFPQS